MSKRVSRAQANEVAIRATLSRYYLPRSYRKIVRDFFTKDREKCSVFDRLGPDFRGLVEEVYNTRRRLFPQF